MEAYKMMINGQWTDAESGETKIVVNPTTLEELASVPMGGSSDTKKSIDAAHTAFTTWKQTSAYERAELLRAWYNLIIQHKEDLARTMTKEQGKPLSESRGEIEYAASFIEWYAEEAKRNYGETIPATARNKRILVIKQPVGVIAAITPWNFPAAMITRKVGPALAAGCTCIVKPAGQTPLTALKLARLAEEAGFPSGVINILTGKSSEIGDTLMEDARVAKLSFTGSTEIGKHLMRGSAETVKKISLELGGHAPVIVMDDADLDTAVQETIRSKFRNAGQTCICANRIYVQQGIREAFEQRLTQEMNRLSVGNGLHVDTAIGPLIDEDGLNKVAEHVEDAKRLGASVLSGGSHCTVDGCSGYFYQPTVLSGVTDEMLMMREETFGPVAPIIEFKDEAEALARANNTRYGLASYLFTDDIDRATRIAEQLEYGIVGVNDGGPSSAQAPFGGVKESGIGREGGHFGLDEYTEVKYISFALKQE